MVTQRLLLLTLTCSVLVWTLSADDLVEVRSVEEEKELIDALQEVLEKLRNKQIPSTEKRLGWVSSCEAGEQCAVRKGARFGKVCTCPEGTACSFSALQCL
ncbi:cocaine- and amphetamine-regulated transcript protein [Hoplias malabaricus]|uniref:cocaine- and amphetamine-regulated transcript protein n=1 Tax=Hoplias malabaricus TaxID=27720 RepID=UPI003461DFAE